MYASSLYRSLEYQAFSVADHPLIAESAYRYLQRRVIVTDSPLCFQLTFCIESLVPLADLPCAFLITESM